MPLKTFRQSRAATKRSLLDFLIDKQVLKPDFRQILSGKTNWEIEQYLISHQLINKEDLLRLYSEFFAIPFIRLVGLPISREVLSLIPEDVARRFNVVAYDKKGLDLYLAVGEPSKLQLNAPEAVVRLRREKGLRVHLAITPKADLKAVLNKLHNLKHLRSDTVPPVSKESDLGSAVVEKSKVVPSELTKQVEARVKQVDLSQYEIAPEVINKIPRSVAERYKIIVFAATAPKSPLEPTLIKVAAVNPNDIHVKEILHYIEQKNRVLIDRYETTEDAFTKALKLYDLSSKVADSSDKKAAATIEVEKEEIQPQEETTFLPRKNLEDKSGEASAKRTPPSAEEGGLQIKADEIINRPSAEGVSDEELIRLAKEQQESIDDQNLDRLLREPVDSVEALAKVYRSGVIPQIVAATLFLAIKMRASDVHIEAAQGSVRVRYRVDGILHDIIRVPAFLHAPLISRIKILAKMKIDEQRVPQDGRFDVVINSRQVDLRVSTLPTVHGEKIVMRLLDKSQGILTLEQLGVTGTNFDRLIENIKKPYGIILSTGPTGSGKSTTLYAILNRISKPGINIITLEDPVEYELAGVNQAQVKPQIGFTFAEGLRSVLRQDPNVIMVGEIRDLETAAMATHAALTGHLVLSTLHTNDSSGALPRLINMGVEPFLITSSMNAVIGQRLVRKICEHCRERAEIPEAVLKFIKHELEGVPAARLKGINLEQLVFYKGRGCSQCSDGYKGRIGIFEVLTMNDQIEDLAVRKVPASEIKKAAISSGMTTMMQDGLIKALKGITTVDEILRVTTTKIREVPGI